VAKFGIPYMGSKSKLALDLIGVMPTGRRFVDLFGGGFAMSHCAYLSGRFEEVYYNDINPLLVPLIQDAIDGKYSYDVFKPNFITREEFFEKKDTCGYVKYIWSFSNEGKTYMFGRHIEDIKRKAHDYVVFDVFDIELEEYIGNGRLTKTDITGRRLELYNLVREHKATLKEKVGLEPLERLERLQQLEGLQRLQQLERLQQLGRLERLEQDRESLFNNNTKLTLNTGNYTDYEYQEGDVVYCDIPYENTRGYNKEDYFDHEAFYKWALSRDYTVYISSYELPEGFFCFFEKERRCLANGSMSTSYKTEKLFTNKA
jgi:site-specific DNA-adenine methylase